MKHIIVATLLTFAMSSHTVAQVANDRDAGLFTSQEVCAECHAVRGRPARSPNAASPTSVKIANTPGMTGMALQALLASPHAGMPMFILTSEQRTALIAYILSLKE